jgi:hypothetical protein
LVIIVVISDNRVAGMVEPGGDEEDAAGRAGPKSKI